MKHIFTRLTQQKSFISSSCVIIANINCTFRQVSILENRFSGKFPFGQMYILASVHSGKCTFGEMSIRPNVHSGKCPFWKCTCGKMSIRPSVFRGNVLSERCFSGRCTGSVLSGNSTYRRHVRTVSIFFCIFFTGC